MAAGGELRLVRRQRHRPRPHPPSPLVRRDIRLRSLADHSDVAGHRPSAPPSGPSRAVGSGSLARQHLRHRRGPLTAGAERHRRAVSMDPRPLRPHPGPVRGVHPRAGAPRGAPRPAFVPPELGRGPLPPDAARPWGSEGRHAAAAFPGSLRREHRCLPGFRHHPRRRRAPPGPPRHPLDRAGGRADAALGRGGGGEAGSALRRPPPRPASGGGHAGVLRVSGRPSPHLAPRPALLDGGA